MSWRVADTLIVLRNQIDEMFPGRSKLSDGTIGDASHASRRSDHNPWVHEGKQGIVTAMDLTHDPLHGADMAKVSEALRLSEDHRIKYVIFNRRIFSGPGQGKEVWKWRPYSGVNPHNKHMHVSVQPNKADFDSKAPWTIPLDKVGPVEVVTAHPSEHPTLREGAVNLAVSTLQTLLKSVGADLLVTGRFDSKTKAAVVDFQSKKGLIADGVVGPYTWEALEHK